jgi:enoyl-CoA hydratase
MNRPERMNALGGGLGEALNEMWLDFKDDPELRVAILTGAGDRAFSAGADLRANDARARQMGAQSAQEMLDADRARGVRPSFNGNNFGLWKPVIAAINGWCLAGGCEMSMGCDLRIMEEQAQLGLPEVKRGMGAKQTTHKLYFLTTLPMGLDIDWTGDPITAQQAFDLGLVNEVVPKGQSLKRAMEIAEQICRFPNSYLQYQKLRLFQSIGLPVDYALALEQRAQPHQSAEYRPGLEASLKTRLPGT